LKGAGPDAIIGGVTGPSMDVRFAQKTELDHLAKVWHEAWHDAHARIVPAELTRVRTVANFRRRLEAALPAVRVAGPVGSPVGFHIVQGDELYQLFVAAEARGTGVARALIEDAEARLAEKGVRTAWLACAIGNDRAARFYEKCGWRRLGTIINHLRTEEGPFDLEVWRYEKVLSER
jgi:ribosomal protein S18 acetylase RimI-like enzyme